MLAADFCERLLGRFPERDLFYGLQVSALQFVHCNDLREQELSYESTLAEVYNAHREQVDGLNLELTNNDEDLQQGAAAMNQWRTQWEEELTEKNSIDAELLTLRSEFEKSR